jgi:hypothetical protein
MSLTLVNLPNITISEPFGRVRKVVWFEVNDTFGIFNLDLSVVANQALDTNITIFNKVSNSVVFQKTYKKTSNNIGYSETIKITHIPNKQSPIYGILIS